MKKLAVYLVVSLLAACTHGSSLDGTYVAKDGHSLTFKPDGTAYEKSGGKVIDQFKYSVEGNTIKTEDRVWQLTILPNGSLGSLADGEMKKQ